MLLIGFYHEKIQIMQAEKGEREYQFGLLFQQRRNFDQAAAHFQEASFLGHAKAMHQLSRCYQKGEGLPQSNAHEEYWLRMSAERGEREAILCLSFFHIIARCDHVSATRTIRRAVAKKYVDQKFVDYAVKRIEKLLEQ